MTNNLTTNLTMNKVEDAFRRTIEQKLIRSVDNQQIRYLFTGMIKGEEYWYMTSDENPETLCHFDNEEYDRYVLTPESFLPTSNFHVLQQMSTGIQSRSGVKRQVKAIAKTGNGIHGRKLEVIDREIYWDDKQMEVQMRGEREPVIYSCSDVFYINNQDEFIPAKEDELTEWKVYLTSVSNRRAGNATYLLSKVSRLEHMEKALGIRLETFIKPAGKGYSKIGLEKASTRGKMADSASLTVYPFQDWVYMKEEEVPFTSYDGERYVETGEIVPATVFATRYTFMDINGMNRHILVAPAFEVLQEVETLLPKFGKEDYTEFVKQSVRMNRDVVDGSAYMDERFAKEHGISYSSQFRMSRMGKGFNNLVENLKKDLGAEMVLFDGTVKGDIGAYFRESDLDFAVFNKARDTEENAAARVSRQVTSALASSKIVKEATKETKAILHNLYDLVPEVIREFINTPESDEDYEDEPVKIDNLTVQLFLANPEEFQKSAADMKNLYNLLDATVKELVNGAKLYVKEASIKHMVVDPYSVVRSMKQGKMGLAKNLDMDFGVVSEHAIVTDKNKEGFFLNDKKGFLARFPFLHAYEGRLVNKEGETFLDEETRRHYERAMKRGKYQGVIIYSLWDMVPEGQSGADYDGDTTLFITNPYFVDNFVEGPLFLDYSLVWNEESSEYELVSGAPSFGDNAKHEANNVFTESQLTYMKENNVRFEKGDLIFPEDLVNKKELREIVADGLSMMGMLTTTQNYIGMFTNIKSTVDSILFELNDALETLACLLMDDSASSKEDIQLALKVLEKERNGYNRLSLFLACAIRWEIDRAKHGGNYMAKLGFLEFMTGEQKVTMENIKKSEEKYGVSLQRLFFGDATY